VLLEELKTTRRKTCPFRTLPDLRDDFREPSERPLAGRAPVNLARSSIKSGERVAPGG